MSNNIKLVKNTKGDKKTIKDKVKRIENSDGFFAITLKREGFYATGGLVRHSITDEEIIYWLENYKLQILQSD